MNGVHFGEIVKPKRLEICKHASIENSTIFDLCFVYLTWFELNLALQVNVSCGKDAVIKIRVQCPD